LVLSETASTGTDAWGAILAAVVPILLGGITTYFKLFISSKEDFRQRTRLKRSVLCERMATRLAVLCQHIRSLGPDDCLRGDGREESDLVGEYTEENFRVFRVYRRLDILDGVVKYAHFALYITIVLGLGGALLAWLSPESRCWVIVAALALIGLQVLTVLLVQMACWKLDDYEDVA
jgi:hypothetical protein